MIDIARAIGESFEDSQYVSYRDEPGGTVVTIYGSKSEKAYRAIELCFGMHVNPAVIVAFKFYDSSDPIWCEEIDLHSPESIDKIRNLVNGLS